MLCGASPWIPHKAKTELNDTNFLVRIKNFDKEIRVAPNHSGWMIATWGRKMMEQVIILTSKKRLIFTPLYLGWPGSKPKNHWELLEMSCCQDNIKDTTLRKIEKFTKDSNFTPKLVPTSQFVFADELHHFQWGNQVYFWGACSIGWLDPPCAVVLLRLGQTSLWRLVHCVNGFMRWRSMQRSIEKWNPKGPKMWHLFFPHDIPSGYLT